MLKPHAIYMFPVSCKKLRNQKVKPIFKKEEAKKEQY